MPSKKQSPSLGWDFFVPIFIIATFAFTAGMATASHYEGALAVMIVNIVNVIIYSAILLQRIYRVIHPPEEKPIDVT